MKPRRGIACSADLKARSTIDPLDRNPYDPCWHWTGSKAQDGVPRIWALDHDIVEKHSMSGPKAVWNISRSKGTGDRLAYRTCCSTDCVNPGHIALAKDKAEIGAHIAAIGHRKGKRLVQRMAALKRAWAQRGLEIA
jgi:hypothetical protein